MVPLSSSRIFTFPQLSSLFAYRIYLITPAGWGNGASRPASYQRSQHGADSLSSLCCCRTSVPASAFSLTKCRGKGKSDDSRLCEVMRPSSEYRGKELGLCVRRRARTKEMSSRAGPIEEVRSRRCQLHLLMVVLTATLRPTEAFVAPARRAPRIPRLHRRAPVTLALDGLDPRPAGESSEPEPELPLDEAGALGTDSPGPPPPRKKVNVRPSVGGSALDQYLYLEDLSEPYWRRNLRVQYVTSWPVGTPEANPKVGGTKSFGNIEFFRGLRDDLKRKSKCYPSDWLDGLRSGKSIAAIAFLYFACLAPVVAFGGALSSLTQGAMGVVEVLLSCGLCGMAYATIAGQPMTFVAPTGLTLAFTAALYRYCTYLAVPFLPMCARPICTTGRAYRRHERAVNAQRL